MEQTKVDENSLEGNIIQSHKFNFYQQFFVISIDPKIMCSINHYDLKALQEPYSSPKVISKYPNIDLPYLIIPDSEVASHCFPQGIINEIIDYDDKDLIAKENQTQNFVFALENMYPDNKTSSLRTKKVYYTCLLFYENIEKYRSWIDQKKHCKNNKNNEELQNKGLLIPKVICLSSFSPFYEQTKYILHRIKNYVNNFNYNNKSKDNINIYPIEKIIEGIIFNLPSLPRGNFSLKLDNDSFSYKQLQNNANNNALNNIDLNLKNIIFQETPPNANPRETFNYSILMKYFRIEEIFEVIKFIILEEPILFFSEDKEALTNVIECLVSLIYPLEYPYPVIAILPEQNYSLISLFKHFIFGINYRYSEDFLNRKIILDGVKFIRIIRLDKRFNKILNSDEPDSIGYQIFTSLKFDENKPLIKFDQIEQNVYRNDKEDTKLIHEKKKINLPRHYFEKCCRKLEKSAHEKMKEIESKNKNQSKEVINQLKIKAFNIEIRDTFLYFFCCILLKYQEYCVKYEKQIYEALDKDGTTIEKEFEERNIQLDEKFYKNEVKIDDIFNAEEFINSTPSLDRTFYRIFFGTKIFFNFILKKLFPDSNQDKLDILYFDEIINKKLSRELYNQKKETKYLDLNLENLKNDVNIKSLKKELDNNIKQYLYKKTNRTKALNYFQYIYLDDENEKNDVGNGPIYFYYYVFPILLNDGIFYNERHKNKNNSDINIWSFYEYSTPSQKSRRLFDNFEEESAIIIDDDDINKNYILYDYSLNPTSQFRFTNDFLIKNLWLVYFSKSFKSIPFNKKRYFFDILMNFMQKNRNIIDENVIISLFNSINKNGDRSMNQDFFQFIKNKTYTSYLCAREKMKSEKNFIKYLINQENNTNNKENTDTSNFNTTNTPKKEEPNNKEEQKKIDENIYEEKRPLLFIVNSYCTNKVGDKKEMCQEPIDIKIAELFSEQEDYIKFKCKKCQKEQNLKIFCKYNNDGEKKNYLANYIINFELLSPISLLNKPWLKNNSDLNPYYISENYLECYLSAVFYFYEQNYPCGFLMPEFLAKNENELKEDNNNYYSIINNEEFFDEKKIKKICVKNNLKVENVIVAENEDNEEKEEDLKADLAENCKEMEGGEIDKMIQSREILRKYGNKSSFRKKNINPKKKSVEFKIDLKNAKFKEE